MSIIIAIIVFGLLIFIHELGHYTVAKMCDIKVDEFAIGMGPKLFGLKKGETLYSVRILPFGGYVKMDGEDSSSSNERAFSNKPVWQRFLVVIAGATMNLLLGFILLLYLVSSFNKIPDMKIVKFDDNAISSSYGLREGDKIMKIGGHRLKTKRDFNYILAEISEGVTNFTVERNGEIINIKDVKLQVIEDKNINIKIPVIDFEIGTKKGTFIDIIGYSFNSVVSDIKSVCYSLIGVIRGKYGLKSFVGPVQITKIMGTVSANGVRPLINFVSFLTINLGFFNLLPLPALDGGKVVFLLIEAVRRKPIKPELEGYINLVGFALLIGLALIVTYNDIIGLVKVL